MLNFINNIEMSLYSSVIEICNKEENEWCMCVCMYFCLSVCMCVPVFTKSPGPDLLLKLNSVQ